MRKAVKIRGYFSKPKGVCLHKSLGNIELCHTYVIAFHKCTTIQRFYYY